MADEFDLSQALDQAGGSRAAVTAAGRELLRHGGALMDELRRGVRACSAAIVAEPLSNLQRLVITLGSDRCARELSSIELSVRVGDRVAAQRGCTRLQLELDPFARSVRRAIDPERQSVGPASVVRGATQSRR